MTSIVIPAHNEAQVIGRLLDSLLSPPPTSGDAADDLDIVVVCNGCTDATARVAAERGPGVRVVEIPVPSKHTALRVGDEHARGFPRLYVDADVVISGADARAVARTLGGRDGRDGSPELLAAAPERELPLTGCAWAVRAYYRVWQRLPAVREGLFGRGVIAVTEAGHARLTALPPLMADDLAASLAFAPEERTVVGGARVVIQPPRTWRDLIHRRIRAATSTAQLEQSEGPLVGESAVAPSARTSRADLRDLLRAEPALLPALVVFLAAAVVARRGSRRAIGNGDFHTWLRDESSRRS
ncbi:glycosyltransferase family 2 protein [Streptacidiphilus sp. P02-A3a]|uniref:glycosyltransferase n=1 Tax=Streptacidiphilus sp. P02-A3a TaxID=2704468 RepID=UPI0015FA6C80|nr:glycosyltransferase family 2 protein [Streptacidiphilus sp. P02-A3a]QMU71521.1 glycosyltransferase family 2 protein [Streptacidiphilus sp. P02-A3a]